VLFGRAFGLMNPLVLVAFLGFWRRITEGDLHPFLFTENRRREAKSQRRRHVAFSGIDPGRDLREPLKPARSEPASNVHAPLAVSDACLATFSLPFTPQLHHAAPPALPRSAASASYGQPGGSQGRDASRSGRGAAHSALAAAGDPELPANYCGSWQFGRVSQSFLAR